MAPKKVTSKDTPKEAAKVVKEAPKEQPVAKKAKVEEKKVEEKKVPEKKVEEKKVEEKKVEEKAAEPAEPTETEVDAKKDEKPRVKDVIAFESAESTLNLIPALEGRILTCLTEGGMQYLIASGRANVGAKGGRYLYEVKMIEALNPPEGQAGKSRPPMPKQLVRIGFSLAGSSTILGDGDAGVYFDSEGGFHDGVKRLQDNKRRFGRNDVVGIVLNLDAKSPNANTVSIFKNGVRASQPSPLPEGLCGKPLFPHVALRNVTLQVNFGPEPLKPLPFKCRTLQDATLSDASVMKAQAPKDGKYEVLFPVGFPDEGTFEWLDTFLEKNPQYTELSDRKIIEWAAKSGLAKNSKFGGNSSNDKPAFDFGLPMMDDFSVRRVINTAASIVPRNYLVMEVKQNLTPVDRQANLKRFPNSMFRKVAKVMMGEPSKEFKKMVKDKLLKVKQTKAETAWKAKKAEKDRKAVQEKKQKEMAAKLVEKMAAAKKAAEAKKKAAEKTDEEKKEEGEETKAEEKEEEPAENNDAEMEVEEDETPPEVTLTEEEEKQWFIKGSVPDLAQQVLDKNFGTFALPAKSEGFDEIQFEWQKEKASNDYLRTWVLERKRTSRVEDLQPGEWFKTNRPEWLKKLDEWQKKQKEIKAKKPVGKKVEDEEEEALDIFNVEDVNDVGSGKPMYLDFGPEDWALMKLRWDIFALAEAYKLDVNDADRLEIPEAHVPFYFNRYFKTNFTPKQYGKDNLAEMLKLIKDTAKVSEAGFLTISVNAEGAASFDLFVKLTEEARRERQRRIDAGDETARLKLPAQILSQNEPKTAPALPSKIAQSTPANAAPVSAAGAKASKGKGKGKA